MAGGNLRHIADILISAIARRRKNGDAPALYVETIHQIAHGAHGSRIMRVVEDDLERMFVVDVHATRRLEEGRVEGAQAVADVLEADTHVVGEPCREHGVLHVVHCPTLDGRRNEMRPEQRRVDLLVIDRDHMPVHALLEHQRLPARLDVLLHQGVIVVHRDVADCPGFGVVGHLQAQGVIGVQHGGIRRDFDRHPLDLGKLLEGIDAAQPEMIFGYVEATGDIAVLVTHAAPQQAAARRFHDGRVH